MPSTLLKLDVWWFVPFLCLYTAKIFCALTISSTSSPPVRLRDIGYDGSWEKFCDRKEMKRDFPLYHTHELKSLREMICNLKETNKLNKLERTSQIALAAYKYCEMVRSSADDFLTQFIERFSQDDDKKRAEIVAPGPMIDSTACFNKVLPAFRQICVDKENPFFRMFSPLLARACTVQWLTTNDILRHIEEVCSGKHLSANIDWQTIFYSIPFIEETT